MTKTCPALAGASVAAWLLLAVPLGAGPSGASFRITLNGFDVTHESDDDILEGDGVRDEVFITSQMWMLDKIGGAMLAPEHRQSLVMGQRGPEKFFDRVSAGAGGEFGGLATGNQVPARASRDPWRRTEAPRTDGRLPMLLAEVKLEDRFNVAVVAPILWEWDSADASPSQRAWDAARDLVFTSPGARGPVGFFQLVRPSAPDVDATPGEWGRLASSNPSDTPPVFRLGVLHLPAWPGGRGKSGTRPIGWVGEGNWLSGSLSRDRLLVQGVALSYAGAMAAARTDYFGLGPGIVRIRYADMLDHGDYTLYLQIEELK